MIIFSLPTGILKMIIRKHIFAALVFVLLSTVLIFSWFRYGHLYGGGDVGIPSYNPQRIVDIAKFVWWEAGAPGNLVPHGVTSLPVQFLQSALVELGLPYFAVQATLFWILLFLTGYGMFLVGLSVFGRDKFLLSILCGLFYLLNPYIMISVWHRFIHNSFFLAAFLPFFYLFWDDWIKKGKFISIFYFLVLNFLGVYLYGSIAYVATVMFVLFFVFLKNAFLPLSDLTTLKNLSKRFVIGVILWGLIHAWWMIPTFSIVPALVSSQHGISESVATLVTLSKQTVIPYTLSGINPFYLFEQADFGSIYEHPVFLTILWIPLIFLIPGLISSIKSKILAPFGLLFISAVFLAKGAAAPFGLLFISGISNIFALGVLRNPNEKLGILLPFSLAIIYAVGIKWYLNKFPAKYFKLTAILLSFLLFLQMGVYLWPFWTGKLIGNAEKQAFVEVPEFYLQADNYIKDQKQDGRILHLPLPTGESVSYNWPYPFSGIESSQLLFSSLPSISRGLNIKHVDDIIGATSNIFREDVGDEKIIAILRNLNVRFIVLHKDIYWQGGFLDDPAKLEKILDGKKFLEKKQQFGDLIIYEILAKYFQPKIYVSQSVNFLSTSGNSSFWPYLLSQNNNDLLQVVDNKQTQLEQLSSQQNILLPAKVWTYHPKKVSFEKAISELPAASNILPGSSKYFLVKLKENLRILVSSGSDRLKLRLTYAGKRLVEAERLKEKDAGMTIINPVVSYQKILTEIFYAGNLKGRIDALGGRSFLDELFSKHLVILDDLFQKGDEQEKIIIQKIKNELLSGLGGSEIKPYFEADNGENTNDLEYTVYRFNVPLADQYELLMADQQTGSIYADKLNQLQFQIDGKKEELTGVAEQGFISYGKIKLENDKREIILAATPSANLYRSSDNEITLSSTASNGNFFEAKIEPATPDTWYTIQFDAWIQKGEQFELQLVSDTGYVFNKVYTRDDYNNFWNHYRIGILLDRPASSYTGLRFLVEPWDECQIAPRKEFCSNKLYNPRKEPSTVLFRNIQIQRLLNNPVFLRSENKNTLSNVSSQVNFIQKSPVLYSGKIKLEKPGFVIFSEAFHDGWQFRLFDEKESFVPEKKFLANLYANAWYIEKAGEYNFELEFIPQRKLNTGIKISVAGFILIGLYLIWSKRK